jgi:hypothetical protein
VAFSGEEEGLLGSNAYAADAVEKGWNIAGVLNADMISYAETADEGNYLIVFQNEASEWLYNCTLSISTEYAEYIQLTLFKAGFTGGSDHYSFWEHGYNAVFYYESRTTPHYHKSGDTIAHINATYTVKNIRLILGTLAELSEARYLNNPPEKPVLTGSATGVVNQWYNLSVVTTDPDEDEVYYFIDWGDGQVDEWVGPYTSRVIVELSHKWDTKGTYTIRAKAKDKHEVESDWGTLTVTMPVSYTAPLRMSWEQPCQQFHNTYLLPYLLFLSLIVICLHIY